MNSHLPVFTEVQGYNMKISELRNKLRQEEDSGSESDEESTIRGYESEEDDLIEEPHGIKGMTL